MEGTTLREEDDAELEQLRSELQSTEARYRALMTNISDVVMLISPAGTILYAGPSTPGVLGHTAETFIGRSMFEVIHPFDKETMKQAWDKVVSTPGELVVVQFRARHKNGTWIWFEGTGHNLISDPAVEAVVANFHPLRGPEDTAIPNVD
jgi:PAS domain S-box-containing protein